MGLFTKKKENKGISLPELPQLPELPEFPEGYENNERLSQLPSFPSSSLGDKFSQNAIKEAVTGREEVNEVNADESIGTRMMQESQSYTQEIEEEVPRKFREAAKLVKNAEPVFIRIDKFENGLEVFEKAKKKIIEIEKMLKDIRELKEKEELEISGWEKEIQTTKEQIERVDKELFSKIE